MTENKWYIPLNKLGVGGFILAGSVALSIGMTAFVQHYEKKHLDSFLEQEEKQVFKELADCGRILVNDMAYANIGKENPTDEQLCAKQFGEDNPGYKWCLSREGYNRFTDCREDTLNKSLGRMKQYMRHPKGGLLGIRR